MQNIYRIIHSRIGSLYPREELSSLSRIICRDILQLSLIDVYSGKDIKLSPIQEKILDDILLRLSNHEPIQYITGETEFMGLPFTVRKGALIPRPETEELVEYIIGQNSLQDPAILDIGTGSGCIAVSLAHYIPLATVEAWDISPEALLVASDNNRKNKTNVSFKKVDILNAPPVEEYCYDIIVSNPPYIAEKEKEDMEPHVLNWEPYSALFVPDHDPLLFYREIINFSRRTLKEKGLLCFEINQNYGEEIVALLQKNRMGPVQLRKDLFNKDRFIIAQK